MNFQTINMRIENRTPSTSNINLKNFMDPKFTILHLLKGNKTLKKKTNRFRGWRSLLDYEKKL